MSEADDNDSKTNYQSVADNYKTSSNNCKTSANNYKVNSIDLNDVVE